MSCLKDNNHLSIVRLGELREYKLQKLPFCTLLKISQLHTQIIIYTMYLWVSKSGKFVVCENGVQVIIIGHTLSGNLS